MSTSKKLFENLLVIVSLCLMSVIMVTIIGYFDEGHYRVYGSFGNYLTERGYPPINDYLMWSAMSTVIGLVVFNLISARASQNAPFPLRLMTTIMTVPALFFTIIFLLSIAIS